MKVKTAPEARSYSSGNSSGYSFTMTWATGLLALLVPALTGISSCKQSGRTLKPLEQGQFAKPSEVMAVKITDYRPVEGREFKDLFVRNLSVQNSLGKLLPVSSRDGLTDTVKQSRALDYGFMVGTPHSTSTGFSDLVLYLGGLGVAKQSAIFCPDSQRLSTSNDALQFADPSVGGRPQRFIGLRDCEKIYLGLDPSKFDFDADGVPDYLELRCGLNPRNKADARISTAGDAVTNTEKCKRGIPVDESADTQPNQLYAYEYKHELRPDGTRHLGVKNIPLFEGGRGNVLAFYLTEVDLATKAVSLYTAFAILKEGSTGSTLQFKHWVRDPATYFNQEIVQP